MELLSVFKYIGYGVLLLGAITTILTDILKDRKDAVVIAKKDSANMKMQADLSATREMLTPVVELARKYFPGMNDEDALDSLRKRMDLLNADVKKAKEETKEVAGNLEKEKNTIKQLEAKLRVSITGDWEAGKIPFAIWTKYPSPSALLELSGNGKSAVFKTMGTSGIAVDEHTALLETSLAVDAGSFPIAAQIADLAGLSTIALTFPIAFPAVLHSPQVTLTSVKIQLFINGAAKGEYIYEQLVTFDIEQFTKGKPYKEAITTFIPFSVEENVGKAFMLN